MITSARKNVNKEAVSPKRPKRLNKQQYTDLMEWVDVVETLGFEPEFEHIDDPACQTGDHMIARVRRLTEQERSAVKERIRAAHTFKPKQERRVI